MSGVSRHESHSAMRARARSRLCRARLAWEPPFSAIWFSCGAEACNATVEPECTQHSTNNTQQTTQTRHTTHDVQPKPRPSIRRCTSRRSLTTPLEHSWPMPSTVRHPPTCLSFMRTRPMATPHLTDRSACTQPTRSRSLASWLIHSYTLQAHALTLRKPGLRGVPLSTLRVPLGVRADPDCVAGLIIGTGTNICYVEKGENVTKLGTLRANQCTRARARSLALARTHSTHSMHRNPPAPPRPDP
jgi:hypothetical protein